MGYAWYRSISFRVTLSIALVAIALVAVQLRVIRPRERLLDEKHHDTMRLARVIERDILSAMERSGAGRIQREVVALREVLELRSIEVADAESRIRYSSNEGRRGLRVDRERDHPCRHCHGPGRDKPESAIYPAPDGGSVFAVDRLLRNGERCRPCHAKAGPVLGNLLIEVDLAEHDLEMLGVADELVRYASVFIALLVVGMAAVTHFIVGRPAVRLMRQMERVEKGDLNERIMSRSADEFGYLARAFGRMVGRLRDLYRDMEEKIDERTRDRDRARAQVVHQEKLAAVGLLAAGVAHEIGNPLTAIDSMTQLLAAETDDANVREKVKTIQRQVDRISQIVHSMADLSRPLSAEVRRTDVHVLLDSVLRLVKYDKRFRSIRVRTEYGEEVPRLDLVEDRVFGVFLNLALNAADAMPGGGTLTVRTDADESRVIVEFRDTGTGIAPEDRARVFEPYFTTKAPGRGTGLGLTISRTLLREMGGDLALESEVGRGSTFVVSIPCRAPHGETR